MARRKQLDFSAVATPVQIGEAAREILQKTVDDGVADLEMAKEIWTDLIDPDPDQPRKHFDEESLRDLALSIRLQGVLQPIVVEWIPETERFRIISGERRWRAARMAAELQEREADAARPRRELSRIPAIIKNPSAVDRYLQQVYENEQRQDYSDVERAIAYERLKESLGLTWEELAGKLGLSKGRIHQIRRTKNRLAPSVQLDITQGRLTGRHGLYLAPLPAPLQETIAAAVKEHQLTHQQTQAVVQRVRLSKSTRPPAGKVPPEQEGAPGAEAEARGATEDRGGQAVSEGDSRLPLPLGEGWGEGSTLEPSDLVKRAVEEVTAPRTEPPQPRYDNLGRTLAIIRQLQALAVSVPEAEADRASLAQALDELIAWAQALRTRLDDPGV